jgi:hypothetical protein
MTINHIRDRAGNIAKAFTWASSSIVVGQFFLITLGTFHYLSWDIMEPVSYLMMLGNFTCGFGFYLAFQRDLAIGNIHDIIVNRITRSAAEKAGISMKKHEATRERITELQGIMSNITQD